MKFIPTKPAISPVRRSQLQTFSWQNASNANRNKLRNSLHGKNYCAEKEKAHLRMQQEALRISEEELLHSRELDSVILWSKHELKSWSHDSMVKSTSYSSRRFRFNSQHPDGSSKSFIFLLPYNTMPSSGCYGLLCTCDVWVHIHTHKIK